MLSGVFEIIGPKMIGPSSSHTAGIAKIGRVARDIFNEEPGEVVIYFAGTLGQKMHSLRSDFAIMGGILGYDIDDPEQNRALQIAKEKEIKVSIEPKIIENAHPATAKITMISKDLKRKLNLTGVSAGGGRIKIIELDDYRVSISGNNNTLVIVMDEDNKIADLIQLLEVKRIGFLIKDIFHQNNAVVLIIDLEGPVKRVLIDNIEKISGITKLYQIQPLFGEIKNIPPMFKSIKEIISLAKKNDCKVSDIVIEQESVRYGLTKEKLLLKMKSNLMVMRKAIKDDIENPQKTVGGLIGGEASMLNKKLNLHEFLSGKVVISAVVKAMALMEATASRKVVIAAPTGGAAGVLPAALLAVAEDLEVDDEAIIHALFTAGGIGMIIDNVVPMSGSVAGCQAECGGASGMAAGALVELAGGDVEAVGSAAAIALKNTLGLVCDPVAGLVEVPCQKRNAILATNAIVSADMALAGIKSVIPVDEVIEALSQIGQALPENLKGNACGGLAVTPTGKKIKEDLKKIL